MLNYSFKVNIPVVAINIDIFYFLYDINLQYSSSIVVVWL